AFSLFDPLFACAALVVEGDNPVDRARQVGDDEADARIKLARMPLDLGDHPARLGPASRSIAEIGMEATYLVRRSPDRTPEQVANPALQELVGRQPDRVFDPLRLQELVDFWHCKGERRANQSVIPRMQVYVLSPAASSSAQPSPSCPASVSPSACGSSACSSARLAGSVIIRASRAASSASVMSLSRFVIASAERCDPPPLKWSDLKYVFWHQGGLLCRRNGTRLKRSSRSCGRSMCWSHRVRISLTRSARSV